MDTIKIVTTPSKKIREVARSAAKGNWFRLYLAVLIILGVMAGIEIVVAVLGSVIPMYSYVTIDGLYYMINFASLVIFPFSVAAMLPIECGAPFFLLGYFRDRQVKYGRLFYGYKRLWKTLGLALLILLKVFLWSLLFMIPGIIAAFRYSMSLFILADHPDYGIRQCIAESKRIMKGNKGKLFCLMLSYIGWLLLWYLAVMVVVVIVSIAMAGAFYAGGPATMYVLSMYASNFVIGFIVLAVLLAASLIPLVTYLGMGVTAFYEILTGGIVLMDEQQVYEQANVYARTEQQAQEQAEQQAQEWAQQQARAQSNVYTRAEQTEEAPQGAEAAASEAAEEAPQTEEKPE